MYNISLDHFLFLGAILFTIGVLGIFLNKKNVNSETKDYIEGEIVDKKNKEEGDV